MKKFNKDEEKEIVSELKNEMKNAKEVLKYITKMFPEEKVGQLLLLKMDFDEEAHKINQFIVRTHCSNEKIIRTLISFYENGIKVFDDIKKELDNE